MLTFNGRTDIADVPNNNTSSSAISGDGSMIVFTDEFNQTIYTYDRKVVHNSDFFYTSPIIFFIM